jgi:hypothetical protein
MIDWWWLIDDDDHQSIDDDWLVMIDRWSWSPVDRWWLIGDDWWSPISWWWLIDDDDHQSIDEDWLIRVLDRLLNGDSSFRLPALTAFWICIAHTHLIDAQLMVAETKAINHEALSMHVSVDMDWSACMMGNIRELPLLHLHSWLLQNQCRLIIKVLHMSMYLRIDPPA